MCEFALHRALVKGINSLVIVLKGDLDLTNITSTLRGVLSPYSGVPLLEWPAKKSAERLFWCQLRDLLGVPEASSM
jgi:hypothetical protein